MLFKGLIFCMSAGGFNHFGCLFVEIIKYKKLNISFFILISKQNLEFFSHRSKQNLYI
jgi:hypothetical protein